MIFKHRYFKLNTASKRVFDENNKELALTGNAYRLLVFLCHKQNATLTDINDFFDPAGAKEYTENHVRQYRHKINSLIGYNVVVYKNNIYSIGGSMSTDELERKWKKFSKKEKVVISSSIILLIIYGRFVLGNKNRTGDPIAEINSSKQTSANSTPIPQDDMILIPAGEFLMGSTQQEILDTWRQNDGGWAKEDYVSSYPQRKITLADFYIDKKEVSNGDYKMFVEATKRAAPSLWDDQTLNSQNLPVVGVDWNDADAYCHWLGKKLPSEAEWEKAARGTDGRIWPWGNVWDPTKDNHGNGTGYGFDESDGWKYTAPVGTELGVSPYGVLNMAGNVYEWTADDFNAYPENDKYLQEDFEKGFKTLRGGAYDDGISEQRASTRCGFRKDYKDVDVGFRCVRDE
ncbi:MAG: formylglycine-generating enzyme family protein [Candidatus Moranbacteria bacterium]|nr:formylglycine-generating enzyme family protein [Candidatus Moranbacteria bacterium]